MILETVFVVFIIILLLVVSHELGHFFAAKYFGVRVDEFGVGIPPRMYGKKIGETFYSINWLPFGGFVRIFGEEEDSTDPRSFSSQSYAIKTFIVASGVAMNVVVGFLLFSFLAWYGTPRFAVEIGDIGRGSPAEQSGLLSGDIIIGLEGRENLPLDVSNVQSYIYEHKGGEAVFLIDRKGERRVIRSAPRREHPSNEGPLGMKIGPKDYGVGRVPWYRAPWEGMKATGQGIALICKGFWMFLSQFFSTGSVPGEVLGPVGIAGVAEQTFRLGMHIFLQLVALLSLNLAIMNILPIPALDGGRIFFFFIEKIKGSPIPTYISQKIHAAFLILLIGLLLLVTYHDIARMI